MIISATGWLSRLRVSMESGLEDRNNSLLILDITPLLHVSMESGLEDRNNYDCITEAPLREEGLNGVRPRRPEQ